MTKLLIVDDEEKIRQMIEKYALHEGYQCVSVSDGIEALEAYRKEDFSLVIMDIMMPGMDGYQTLKKMKEIRDVPCIFLTALSQEYDKIYGFDVGADDYVVKPFSLKELMMRIKAILKRSAVIEETVIIKNLIIDETAHQVRIYDEVIPMAKKEYDLLLLLIKNRGVALSRETILEKVWGYENESDDRTLDTHMKLLRRDLREYGKLITTIRGVGYRFEKED